MLKKNITICMFIFCSAPTVLGNSDGISVVPYYIAQAARAFKLNPALLMALCTQESRCNPKAYNKFDSIMDEAGVRHKNPSYGLFQIKRGTAKGLGYEGTPQELFNPEINATIAAELLRGNIDRYQSTIKAISAHNAGRPIASNKDYVNSVLRHYAHFSLDLGVK